MNRLTNNSDYFHKAEQAFLHQNLDEMSKNLQEVNIEKLPSSDQQAFVEYDRIRILHEKIMGLKKKFQQPELKEVKQPNANQDTSYASLFSRLSNSSISSNDSPQIETPNSLPDSSFSSSGAQHWEPKKKTEKEIVKQPNANQDTSYASLFSRLSNSSISSNDSSQIKTPNSKLNKELTRKNICRVSYTYEAFIESFSKASINPSIEEYQKIANILNCIQTDDLFKKLERQEQLFFLRAGYLSYFFIELHNIRQFLIK